MPNASGQLCRPSQLYDPRTPELRALLNPATAFPAACYCSDHPGQLQPQAASGNGGGGGGGGALPQLQQLGLKVEADLKTLVEAARYVQQTADEDELGGIVLAVARGKVREGRGEGRGGERGRGEGGKDRGEGRGEGGKGGGRGEERGRGEGGKGGGVSWGRPGREGGWRG